MENNYTIKEASEPQSYYQHYNGQSSPQEQYIEIDMVDKTIEYGTYTYVGTYTCSPREFHNKSTRVTVPLLVDPNSLMREIKEDIEKATENYEEVYDGQNYVGTEVDFDEIETIIKEAVDDKYEVLQAWDAADWYDNETSCDDDETYYKVEDHVITAKTTDEELEQIEKDLVDNDQCDGNQFVVGISEWLEQLRSDLN